MPNPMPVEFIDMSNEIGWALAVQKDSRSGMALEFNVGKWFNNIIPR